MLFYPVFLAADIAQSSQRFVFYTIEKTTQAAQMFQKSMRSKLLNVYAHNYNPLRIDALVFMTVSGLAAAHRFWRISCLAKQ